METEPQYWVKQPHHVQAKAPNVQTLRHWGSCLRGPWRRRFEKLHGNLLGLLQVETQPAALEALAQYYDSPIRCFTFKDFQIAPTLEEYERLLGLPLTGSPLYFHQGQPPSWATIARLLRVLEVEMSKRRRNRNGLEGIPRVYIEERLLQFQEEQDWDAMIDILGLLLYGVVLFPYIEDYIDLAAIEVFLAKRDRGENPTMAVLANTYYTLSYCSGRKTANLRCCTPLLYLWLTAHLFQCKTKTVCPVEDFKWSCVRTMTKEQWVRRLGEVTERTIRWYPTSNERQEMITNCGEYPNIPLLGTQGAVNYNPELTARQVGYPMVLGPSKKPSPLSGGEHHEKIRRAWANIIRKGATWRIRSCGASPEYRAWLEQRVHLVGLPWGSILHQDQATQAYEIQETLQVKALQGTLEQMKTEQGTLKRKLETALEEARQERRLSDEFSKKARAEKESRLKIGQCLKAIDQEMCSRRAERDQMVIEKEQLEETVAAFRSREAEREGEVHELWERVLLLEEELKGARLSKEHLQNQRRSNLLALVEAQGKTDEMESQLEELRWTLEDEAEIQVRAATVDAQVWKDRYVKLAWLANQALMSIPRRLRAAEGMMDPTKTPREIKEFLEHCRKLYDRMKELKKKLTTPYRYHSRSKTKDMEQAIEELE
ncbi:hypothetical protein CR513_45435, partial [Mucuna pruriens]